MRRREMTLVELLAAMALLGGLLVAMSQTLVLSFAWGRTADEVLGTKLRADRLGRSLSKALRRGTPLPVLSIDRSGNILEEETPDALETWHDESAVILRGVEVYSIIAQQGAQVVRREIGRDGRVRTETLVRGVRRVSFGLLEDAEGRALGVEYELEFVQAGPPIAGFVGIRTDAVPNLAPPAAPRPAARYRRGAHR